MKTEYNIDLKNYDDTATMIYDLDNQPVYAGGSGPACAPLVTYGYIFSKMKEKRIKESSFSSNRSTFINNDGKSKNYLFHLLLMQLVWRRYNDIS